LRWLALAGLLAAAATLIRFAGQGLILGGAALILFSSHSRQRDRLLRTALFVAFAQIPVSFWLFRNWLLTGGVSDLGFSVRPLEAEPVKMLWRVLMTYWLPEEMPRWLRHSANSILFGSFILVLWRGWARLARPMQLMNKACLAVIFGYCAFLLYTVFTSKAQPHIDFRMLLPVVLPMVLLMAHSTHLAGGLWRVLLAVLCIVILVVGVARTTVSMINMRTSGAHWAWYEH
jgi:hypothetical protein